MIELWGQWVYISHLHACSVLKVKLTNIKLLSINFWKCNYRWEQQYQKTIYPNCHSQCIYKYSKIIDGKCNVHCSEIHLNLDVACFTTIPNIQLMIPNDKRHTCMQAHKNQSSHLQPCTLHGIIWNVYWGEKPERNFRPLNSNQHTSHDTIVCSIEGREGEKKEERSH